MTESSFDEQRAKSFRIGPILAVLLAEIVILIALCFAMRPSQPMVPGGDLAGAEPSIARAVEKARAGVRRESQSANAWGNLGMVLMAHDFLPAAQQCFRQAELLDHSEIRWIYLRAFTHLKDDRKLAAELLRRALAIDERDATCRLLLADVLLGLGQTAEAEQHYLKITDQPSVTARAQMGLARIALSQNDLARALDHAKQSSQSAPMLRSPVEFLMEIYERKGDTAAVEREQARLAALVESPWHDPYLDEVMRHNVGLAPRLDLALRLLDRGQARDAVEILEVILADHPKSVAAWLTLFRARLRLGQLPAAQAAAERALKLSPEDAVAWSDLGVALALQRQWNRAADCFRRSIQLNPHDGDTHYQLAFTYLSLGNRVEAEASFRESVRWRPQFASGWRELGRLLADNANDIEAELCLRRAVELQPADNNAQELLRKLQGRMGMKKEQKQG